MLNIQMTKSILSLNLKEMCGSPKCLFSHVYKDKYNTLEYTGDATHRQSKIYIWEVTQYYPIPIGLILK